MLFWKRTVLIGRLCAVVVLTLINSPQGFGADPLSQLSTPDGLLAARAVNGTDCWIHAYSSPGEAPNKLWTECQGLYLDDKLLFTDQYVSISNVFPSTTAPRLVHVSTSTGGNACCFSDFIIDFTGRVPLIMKDFSFASDIHESGSGVIFRQFSKLNSLGDRLDGIYNYRWGSAKPVLIKTVHHYTTTPLNQKKYSEDVLDDPIMRAPLLSVVGKDNFAAFRRSTEVSSGVKIISGRFVVASGCEPHDCIEHEGIFVIDLAQKRGWAAEATIPIGSGEPQTKLWGTLTSGDVVPSQEIQQWMLDNHLPSIALPSVSATQPASPEPTADVSNYLAAEQSFNSLNLHQRILLQVLLTSAGYWDAVPNKDFSHRLFQALIRFESENGFTPNGVIDGTQVTRLVNVGSEMLAFWGFQKVTHPTRGHSIWIPMGLGLQVTTNEFGLEYMDSSKKNS